MPADSSTFARRIRGSVRISTAHARRKQFVGARRLGVLLTAATQRSTSCSCTAAELRELLPTAGVYGTASPLSYWMLWLSDLFIEFPSSHDRFSEQRSAVDCICTCLDNVLAHRPLASLSATAMAAACACDLGRRGSTRVECGLPVVSCRSDRLSTRVQVCHSPAVAAWRHQRRWSERRNPSTQLLTALASCVTAALSDAGAPQRR